MHRQRPKRRAVTVVIADNAEMVAVVTLVWRCGRGKDLGLTDWGRRLLWLAVQAIFWPSLLIIPVRPAMVL